MTWIELAEFQHKLDIMNQMQTDRQSAGTKSQPNNSKAKESRMQLLSTPASITKEDILNIVHNHKFQVIMPTTTSLDHHQK